MTKGKSRKIISILLSVAMLLSSIFVGGMVASATNLDDLVSITNTYDDETTGSFAGLVQFNDCTPLNDEPGTSLSTRSKTDEEFTLVEKKYVAVSGAQIAEESEGNKAVHFTLAKSSNWNAVVRIYDPNTAGLPHFMAEANKTYEIKFRYKVDSVPANALRIQLIRSKYSGEMHQGNYEYGGMYDESGLERVLEPELVHIDNVTNGWVDAYITFTMPETSHYLTLGLASDSSVAADVWVDDVVVSECIKITAHNYNASADKAIPVSKHTTVSEIEIPEVAGYRFCGIYADENYATKLDSTAQAGAYSDLYFKWEPLTLGEFYCGFEDYKPQTTAMSYDANVVTIGGDSTYVGSKALKATLASNGLTAFELRNESAFEIASNTLYTVTFAYKADADVEIYAGVGKASDVPYTAKALSESLKATGDGAWKTAELTFTADKGTADGYAIAMLLYTEAAAEVFIDNVLVAGPNQSFVNPEINTNFSEDWYPNLALFEGVEPPEIWDGTADTENTMSGSGTKNDPYIITNGNQLAYVIINGGLYSTDNTSKYFEIANDIYLNNTDSVNWKTGDVTTGASVNGWLCTWGWNSDLIQISEDFQGTIDGNGHTIYGVYVDENTEDWFDSKSYCTALIPRVNGATTIKNLGIDNSFVRTAYCASAFIGYTSDAVTFENCYVGENAAVDGYRATTFLSMLEASMQITLKNCYSLASVTHHIDADYYGMVSGCYHGLVDVYNSYNANGPIIGYDHTAVDSSYSTIYKYYDSYRTEDKGYGGTQCNYGVTTITDTANMKGSDVFTNADKMPNLNLDGAYIATEGYPVLAVHEGIEVPEIWDGATLTEPAANSEGVYEITNGAELAFVISNDGMWTTTTDADENTVLDETSVKTFKLVNDIYLNNVDMLDWSDGTVKNSAYTIRSWFTEYNGSKGFIGTIDGNGHTVYGLYVNSIASGDMRYSTGLIPLAAGVVTVKNLGIDKSYINYNTGNASAFVGARAETVYGDDGCIVSLENCFAGENTTLIGFRAAVFRGYQQHGGLPTNITNCYSLANISSESGEQGLVTTLWGTTTIKNTYTTSQVTSATKLTSYISAENVYEAVASGATISGITLISNVIDMKGMDVFTDSAKMPKLNANDAFVATEGYPQLKAFVDETQTEEEEVEIELWDGSVATEFAAGDGTEANPYQISNGAELALAITSGGTIASVDGCSFILTKDIYLNNLEMVNWLSGTVDGSYSVKSWFSSYDIKHKSGTTYKTFAGTIDGNAHTVYGLYINNPGSYSGTTNWAAGLIPHIAGEVEIKNLGVDKAYLSYEGQTSAFIGTADSGASVTIDGCYVGKDVCIDGKYVAAFRAATNNCGAPTTITNSYSLATLSAHNGGNYGLVGVVWGETVIKNSYNANGPIASTSESITTVENCYQTQDGGKSYSGAVTVAADKMKGTDVLTAQDKMPLLNADKAFVTKSQNFADYDYYIYLPEGTVFTSDLKATFFDAFFMPVDAEKVMYGRTMKRGAYLKLEEEPSGETIFVPESLADFVHQGSMAEIFETDFYKNYYGIRTEMISKQLSNQPDDAVNYIFITDTHYGNGWNTKQDSVIIKQMQLIAETAKNNDDIDFVVVGGDITNGAFNSKETMITAVQKVLNTLTECGKPVFVLMGNHDDGAWGTQFSMEQMISDKEWNDNVLALYSPDTIQHDSQDANSKYYYYDLEKGGKTTRIVCLDSIDYDHKYDETTGEITELVLRGESYASYDDSSADKWLNGWTYWGYSPAQLRWLTEVLGEEDKFDDVIFLSHMGIDGSTYMGNRDMYYSVEMRDIISAYQKKTAYVNEELGIDVDYSDTKSKILSYQFGHTHAELTLYSEDIDLWQVNTSTSNEQQNSMDPTAKYRYDWNVLDQTLGNDSEACFDIMSVTRSGVLKMNVGAGNSVQLVNPEKKAGDVNTDSSVDISDLVKLRLTVDKGTKTTAVDVDRNGVLEATTEEETLRKLLLGIK